MTGLLRQIRLHQVGDSILGLILHQRRELCWVIERGWRFNEPYVSCIPPGQYVLESYSSEKYPDTWAMVGGTVAYDEPGMQRLASFTRFACVYHIANEGVELAGCSAPNTTLAHASRGRGVSSRPAMERLRALLKTGNDWELSIEDPRHFCGVTSPEVDLDVRP